MYKPLSSLLSIFFIMFLLNACSPGEENSNRTENQNIESLSFDNDNDGVITENDCNDNDPDNSIEFPYFIDSDNDGFGAGQKINLCSSTPLEGYSNLNTDCDDLVKDINLPRVYYFDADGDGYGSELSQQACVLDAPSGYAKSNDDPDDFNNSIVPNDVDGDGYGSATDCNDNDESKALLIKYYSDADDDWKGSPDDWIEVCSDITYADFYSVVTNGKTKHYTLNSSDTCPDDKDRNTDYNDNGIDDVCEDELSFDLTQDQIKAIPLYELEQQSFFYFDITRSFNFVPPQSDSNFLVYTSNGRSEYSTRDQIDYVSLNNDYCIVEKTQSITSSLSEDLETLPVSFTLTNHSFGYPSDYMYLSFTIHTLTNAVLQPHLTCRLPISADKKSIIDYTLADLLNKIGSDFNYSFKNFYRP